MEEELRNVLKDSRRIGHLLTRIETKQSEIQEAFEEINGINIMLVESVHNTLEKERRDNEN